MSRALAWLGSIGGGLLLCNLPLFDVLGMESAAAAGLIGGLGALCLALTDLKKGPSPIDPGRHQSPVVGMARALPASLALLAPPFLLLLANGLRVRTCDYGAGLDFWLVIPLVSVVIGQTLGWVVASLSRRWRWTLALGFLGAELLAFGWRLAFEPPIVGYSLLFGWFPGSIYDEALNLPGALRWYRAMGLLFCLAAAFALELRWRGGRGLGWSGAAVAVLAFGGLGSAVAWRGDKLGFSIDRAQIIEELGAQVETEHFIITYSPSALGPAQVALIKEDHEYRYAELARFFDEDPVAWKGRKIHSIVYPDRASQSRLMGSRGTLVARPWTHEMNIRWDGIGDEALAHELAHIFTAPFGGGPFRLATQGGVLINLGLIEGIALAADWPADELTPHESVAAMRQMDMAPDLAALFRPEGFWAQPGGKAYTTMGSFVRWLVDSRGIAPFKQVYADGDFEAAYGVGVDALIDEWGAFIDAIPVEGERREQARHRFGRNSIFEKMCARALAELERKAESAAGRGDLARAIDLREELMGYQPQKPEHHMALSRLLERSGDRRGAIEILDRLLERESLKTALLIKVAEQRGDLLWADGRLDEAREAFAGCLELGGGDAARRRLTLKLESLDLEDPLARELAGRYLRDEGGRATNLYTALRWAESSPEDPVPAYLVGLQLHHMDEWEEALPWLDPARGPLPSVALDEQRLLLRGRAALRLDLSLPAAADFEALLATTSSSLTRTQAEEGLDRARWKALGRPARLPPLEP